MKEKKKSQKRWQFKEYRSISSLAKQIYANYHAMSKYQEGLTTGCLHEDLSLGRKTNIQILTNAGMNSLNLNVITS